MPSDLEVVAEFGALRTSVRARIQAALLDATASEPNFELIATAFENLDSEIEKALGREIARGRADDRTSGNLWYKEATGKGVGWAHRWS
eukprot:2066963-Pyramimonas_sp.AAC.1